MPNEESMNRESLAFDLQAIISKFAEKDPFYRKFRSKGPNQLFFELIAEASNPSRVQATESAERLLRLAYAAILKEQVERLSKSIDDFNTNSVLTLSTKLQEFIVESRQQNRESSNLGQKMLIESRWARYCTLALAIATVLLAGFTWWMARSTEVLAIEANGRMAQEKERFVLDAERAALTNEKSAFEAEKKKLEQISNAKELKIIQLEKWVQDHPSDNRHQK